MNSRRLFTRTLTIAAFGAALIFAAAARADESALDSKPIPVKTPPPKYPAAMNEQGIQGLVTVKVVIDEQGNVAECSVNKSTNSAFEEPAVSAIRGWKFKPAVKGGVAVRSQVIIPVKFSREA